MTAELERLNAAIEKLERLRDETVESAEIGNEIMRTALLMVAPVVRILKNDKRLFEGDMSPEEAERARVAFIRAGDLALVDAILGQSS